MMENFHHVHCFLCQKKIQCLESKKKEAKQRYSEHMEKYVIRSLGQPLEKLNVSTEYTLVQISKGHCTSKSYASTEKGPKERKRQRKSRKLDLEWNGGCLQQ